MSTNLFQINSWHFGEVTRLKRLFHNGTTTLRTMLFSKQIGVLAILLLLTLSVQAQFRIDAQIRNRFELRDGYQVLAAEGAFPAAFVSQRTRIVFGYDTEKLKVRISPQDIRVWGDDTNAGLAGSSGNDASLDLYEGFIEFKVSDNGWLKLGRQEWVYDNHSLLSNQGWSQSNVGNDALLLRFKIQDWNLHVASSWNALNQARENIFYPSNRYKNLSFVWLNRTFSDSFKASFIHLAAGRTQSDASNTIHFRHTTGLFSEYKNDNFSFTGNAYYQYGKNQLGKNVSAFLTDLEAGYKINNFTPGVGFSYISGNSQLGADQTTDRLYEPILRSRHAFNGYLDYFTSYPEHTKNGGLVNVYGYLNYRLTNKISIVNYLHYFQLAQSNPTTPVDKSLGFENDLVLRYRFSDWGALESGYSFFLPTESLKTLQGVPNNDFSQFFYVMLTFTPSLFKQL